MKKKKTNLFLRTLYFFFALYVFLFIFSKAGYYEKSVKDKTSMTNEKILQFENDIKENKKLDLLEYLPEEVSYANSFTKSANLISKRLAKIINTKAENMLEFIKALLIG